jgi:hypothetical protein
MIFCLVLIRSCQRLSSESVPVEDAWLRTLYSENERDERDNETAFGSKMKVKSEMSLVANKFLKDVAIN